MVALANTLPGWGLLDPYHDGSCTKDPNGKYGTQTIYTRSGSFRLVMIALLFCSKTPIFERFFCVAQNEHI